MLWRLPRLLLHLLQKSKFPQAYWAIFVLRGPPRVCSCSKANGWDACRGVRCAMVAALIAFATGTRIIVSTGIRGYFRALGRHDFTILEPMLATTGLFASSSFLLGCLEWRGTCPPSKRYTAWQFWSWSRSCPTTPALASNRFSDLSRPVNKPDAAAIRPKGALDELVELSRVQVEFAPLDVRLARLL